MTATRTYTAEDYRTAAANFGVAGNEKAKDMMSYAADVLECLLDIQAARVREDR